MHRPPPTSTLFPYTTLFRSAALLGAVLGEGDLGVGVDGSGDGQDLGLMSPVGTGDLRLGGIGMSGSGSSGGGHAPILPWRAGLVRAGSPVTPVPARLSCAGRCKWVGASGPGRASVPRAQQWWDQGGAMALAVQAGRAAAGGGGVTLQFDQEAGRARGLAVEVPGVQRRAPDLLVDRPDRKSTRLNSSHVAISYAVF